MLEIDKIEELYRLYINEPFYTYKELSEYTFEIYNINISESKIREILIKSYPDISDIKKTNRKNIKLIFENYLSQEQLNSLYDLYINPPFYTYKELSKYILENYNMKISHSKIRELFINNYPNISDIKKNNRQDIQLIIEKLLSEEQLNIIYNLYTKPPFLSPNEIKEYIYNNYKINISNHVMNRIIEEGFSNIKLIKQYNQNSEEVYMSKDGQNISSKDKNNIIELLSEGHTQTEVANILGIPQYQISRIFNKAKLEMEEIKIAKIKKQLGFITLEDIGVYWNEYNTINGVHNECLSRGCNITYGNMQYLLRDVIKVDKKCKICNKSMKIDSKYNYCSKVCSKEARRDYIRTQQYNRRIKGQGKTTQSFSRTDKIKQAQYTCYLCKEKLRTDIKDIYHPLYIVLDHVNPLVISNDTSTANIKPVCRCCNAMKGDKDKDFYKTIEYKKNRDKKEKEYIPKSKKNNIIDDNEFIEDCNNGMTIKELCIKYDRSNYIISRKKKELGLSRNIKKVNKLDKISLIHEVLKLSNEGKTIKQISDILNISTATVSNYRRIAKEKYIITEEYKK